MKEGAWMIFFPEGTRVPVGQKKRYKTGGTRLAIVTGIPVVPLAVNAGEYWPKKSFFKKAGTITVRFGKPIDPQGRNAEEMMAEAEKWIETEMQNLQRTVISG